MSKFLDSSRDDYSRNSFEDRKEEEIVGFGWVIQIKNAPSIKDHIATHYYWTKLNSGKANIKKVEDFVLLNKESYNFQEQNPDYSIGSKIDFDNWKS